MCMGSKSKSSAPPAPVAQPNPNNVADNSNAALRQQAIASSTNPQPSFGSELGNPKP